MPDESSPAERFPHLHLIHRDVGPAKFRGFPEDARTKANRQNRLAHSTKLKQSLQRLAVNWHRRNDDRQAHGLPIIKSGIPFVIEVADDFKLDDLVARYQVEIVAVEELLGQSGGHRYVLVSATTIDGSELLQIVDGFATKASGSATVAGMVEILDDPEDPRRLEAILSPRLRQAWPLPPDAEFLLDVSFQTRGILADLGVKPRKSRRETKEKHIETLAVWFEANKTRLFEKWDTFSMELEGEIQSIITAHGGEIVNQWEVGQWAVTAAKVSFPDSISMRVKMRGRGFTDLILNHPRIFEVREPDETEGIEATSATQPESPPPFQLQPPNVGAPLVCVIDSGMQEGHRLLSAALTSARSVCLLPGKLPADIVDEVEGGGHGTRVGGAVLYPEVVPAGGAEVARCWLGNARVLGADQKLPNTLYPPAMLERVVGHFADCRIFVHSINATSPCPTQRMSGQLFYSTQIPVCLWFLTKNKQGKAGSPSRPLRDRRKQTLFIDARKLGTLIDRVHRELTDADIAKIVSTYHAWRGDKGAGKYEDVAGFAKFATTAEIAAHGHVLTPGRYVGAEEIADDGDPFEAKMPRLVAELHAQFAESAKLEQAINANLRGLGYGG